MAGNPEGSIHAVSALSTAGNHAEPPADPVLVAASIGREFNTFRARLIPKACFKLEDNNFEFDSSFVTVITFDAGPLKTLLDRHPGSKLSIFGHADPVGRDDYNKMLSGRRAQAIFGMLIRDVQLWEELYFNHDKSSGKDEWGVRSIKLMLNRVGPARAGSIDGTLDEPTRKALRDFEEQQGLPPGGFNAKKEVSSATFRKLASIYMDAICTDDDSKDFRLKTEDFLAQGRQRDGKGDFQGCGEFNPLMIFSKDEKKFFDKEENHAQRNAQNQVNRRVMILLFRPGTQVDPQKWPCPSAKEGVDGCRKRFFANGEERRSNTSERRTFQESREDPTKPGTFACRFYERLLTGSPCERVLETVAIRLFDLDGNAMRGVEFFAELSGRQERGNADSNGDFILRDVELPNTCLVRWSRPVVPPQNPPPESADLPPDLFNEPEIVRPARDPAPVDRDRNFEFETVLHLDVPAAPDGEVQSNDEAIVRRLVNLGYPRVLSPSVRLELFRRDTAGQEVKAAQSGSLEAEIVRRHDGLIPPAKD
jgi:hypothetical protein